MTYCAGLTFTPFVRREPPYSVISEDHVLRYSASSRPLPNLHLCLPVGVYLVLLQTAADLEDGYSVACRG
jgi:hypothetical protein